MAMCLRKTNPTECDPHAYEHTSTSAPLTLHHHFISFASRANDVYNVSGRGKHFSLVLKSAAAVSRTCETNSPNSAWRLVRWINKHAQTNKAAGMDPFSPGTKNPR